MYVRFITETAHRANFAVILVTSTEAVGSEEWRVHVEPILQFLMVSAVERGSVAQEVVRVASNADVARIVIPDGDQWLVPSWHIARKTRKPLTLLVMRSGRQRRGSARAFFRWLSKRAVMLVTAAFASVRVAVLVSSTASAANRGVIARVSDPVVVGQSRIAPTLLAGADPSRSWIAVLGAITSRKNVPLVADAVSRVGGARPVGLVIGGKIDSDAQGSIARAVASARDNGVPVLLIDRHLSDDELDGLVCMSDCIVVAHSNEGPSGLVAKAAVAGTPLALAGAQSLRRDAEALEGLATWTPLNSELLARGIEGALRFGRREGRSGSTPAAFAVGLVPELRASSLEVAGASPCE